MTIYRGPSTPPLVEWTIGDLLKQVSRRHPEQTALVHGAEEITERVRWTYAELQNDVDRCTSVLLELFRPGERVGVWAPNVPHWIVMQLSLANAGLVMVSMNPAFRRQEAEHALRASAAAGVVVAQRHGHHELASVATELAADLPDLRHVVPFAGLGAMIAAAPTHPGAPNVRPDDIAQIQFTSGTTGVPKGAMLRHRGVVNNARLMAERVGVRPGTVFIRPSLLYHVGGSVASALMNLSGGGTIIPMARWSPELAVELIQHEGGTLTGGVPTMMRALLETAEKTGADVSTLETVILGAAPIPAELVADLRASLGIETVTMYGQTESGPTVTMTQRSDSPVDTAHTVGTLLPHTEARIVDQESGVDVTSGQTGELWVRSPMVMGGYVNELGNSREALIEGWLRTGDVCAMDDRGYLTVAGRTSDMIIRGGANVYPREIEEVLLTHPAIQNIAVIGVPDERLGEDVAAFVQLAHGARVGADELRVHAAINLARFKIPARWFLAESLPLTASGKVQKHVLRNDLATATPLPDLSDPPPHQRAHLIPSTSGAEQ